MAPSDGRAVVPQGRQDFSGRVAVDETGGRIAGGGWSLWAAVAHVAGMPWHGAWWPAHSGAYCRLLLLQLQPWGYDPKGIITDGWEAYVTARARGFPQAQHLRGRCPALHAASRRRRQTLADGSERRLWAGQRRQVFHTTDQRTVQRRLKTRHKPAAATPVAGVLARLADKRPQRVPAVGAPCRPATSHAAAPFLAAVERFSRLKGPFQHRAAAEKQVAWLLWGDGFSVRSAAAPDAHPGRCPWQQAGYRVGQVPLLHLLNRPHLGLLRDHIAQRFAEAACRDTAARGPS